VDVGLNFFDTGPMYFDGQNEPMVGKELQDVRKEVVIQTKVEAGLREVIGKLDQPAVVKEMIKGMTASLNNSLKSLRTDTIDILVFRNAQSTDIIGHEAVMEFINVAKSRGQIRAVGFATHKNQTELVKFANESKFYDVVMVAYNHKGVYTAVGTGRVGTWDQAELENEMQKCERNDIGVVAMKTCSGGPYSPDARDKPTYSAALKWLLGHSYIRTMAVAMTTMDEIEEDIRAMS
jgi:aryl-alcohol dehydrogenase-like predicted oxidoreductase